MADLKNEPWSLYRWLSTLPLTIGLSTMAAWLLRIPQMASVKAALVPMPFNAAICITLLSIAMLVGKKPWTPTCIIIPVAVAFLALVEYQANLDTGIDEFFVKDEAFVRTSSPGRMAPNTAICFLFAALSVALHHHAKRWERAHRVVGSFAAGVLAIAGTAFIGYLIDFEPFYRWGQFVAGMGFHTGMGLSIIAISILALSWELAEKSRLRSVCGADDSLYSHEDETTRQLRRDVENGDA